MEIWKAIDNYEGIYEISNFGRVKSCPDKITYSEKHGARKWKERILSLKTDRNGYKRVTLYKNKKAKDMLVHRLVAAAFCEIPNGVNIVNHIDGNPSNNHFLNLEWCTFLQNSHHAFKNGLMGTNKKITLLHKTTGQEHKFYSMAEASRFLGKAHGYLSALLKKGKGETKDYKLII